MDASDNNCTYCISGVGEEDAACTCPQCGALYHADCWEENKGCGVYGCGQAPHVEPRQGLEIPMSHWGSEEKACPACAKTIQAAAVRCRFCGNTFDAAPQDADSFAKRQKEARKQPALKRTAVILTVICLFPLTAPLGLCFGALWLPFRWKKLAALPSFFRAVCCIAMVVALIVTVGTAVVALQYQAQQLF